MTPGHHTIDGPHVVQCNECGLGLPVARSCLETADCIFSTCRDCDVCKGITRRKHTKAAFVIRHLCFPCGAGARQPLATTASLCRTGAATADAKTSRPETPEHTRLHLRSDRCAMKAAALLLDVLLHRLGARNFLFRSAASIAPSPHLEQALHLQQQGIRPSRIYGLTVAWLCYGNFAQLRHL